MYLDERCEDINSRPKRVLAEALCFASTSGDFDAVQSLLEIGIDPNEPGPHSTYAKAKEDLNYWIKTRKVPKQKIGLGVPFYGYCFGTRYGESMSYKDIITTFAGADQQDQVIPEGGGVIHYNGLPTIKKKTKLAVKKAGGIMIWQLLQDAEGDDSLLAAIDALIKRKF